MFLKRFILFTCLLNCIVSKSYADDSECDDSAYYVFSWPTSSGCGDKPRGGTSKGAKVTISDATHLGWESIQKPNLTKFEKDRAAILAMAGGYRVDFDFLETVGFSADFERDRPYHSWGTEYIYVVEDKPDLIRLQHLMVMYFEQEDGDVSEPFVMKHWRQDWRYQDTTLLEFDHRKQWRKRSLSAQEADGAWSQAVYQVGDSPRYESIGRWQHNASFSTWVSASTRRPLPRREFSVRDDYHALEGINRQTITRHGWVHEQENWKVVLDNDGKATEYLAKEEGLARYQLVSDVDFSAGHKYMKSTEPFWLIVREYWDNLIDETDKIHLKKQVDGKPIFMHLFGYADKLSSQPFDQQAAREFVKETLDQYQH